MIVEDDFLSIPQIIQNPDEIKLSHKLYEGKPIIQFVKTINGRTTVNAYVSKKHLDLTVQTMCSGKNKRNLATAAGVQAPANTPKAHVGTVPIDIISDSDAKSNSNIKKSERDAVYFEVVKNGDMETAQRMVDEAAKENGYTIKAYHLINQTRNIPISDGKLRAFVLFDIFKIYNIMYMRVNQVVAGNVRKRLSEESPGSIEQE